MDEVQAIAAVLPMGTVSGWALVAVVLLAIIKGWPALRKLQIESDGALRSDLLARIIRLEDEARQERHACAEQLAEMRRDYEARLAAQGRALDALQREIFILRAAAMKMTGKGLADLTDLMQQFDTATEMLEGEHDQGAV